MLRFGMFSLICSVSFGVFGFGGGLSASWVGGQILFLVCLVFSAVGFLGGVLANPTGLRESRIDDRSCYGRPTQDLHGENTANRVSSQGHPSVLSLELKPNR